MIKLSNGRVLTHVVASGALAFDGLGWLWERLLVILGFVQPEIFSAVALKSLSLKPIKGNLVWWHPWTCVKLIAGGTVNKVGLTNPGFVYWCTHIAPKIDFKKYKIIVSIFGSADEALVMVKHLNLFPDLVAIEWNDSCPNTGHGRTKTESTIEGSKVIAQASKHPLILKLAVDQEYLVIAEGVKEYVQAISLNSVPWVIVFPKKRSPLWRLERKVKGGFGGVSGKPAQDKNWEAVKALVEQGAVPVIAPSVMSYEDVVYVLDTLKAPAVSYGAIHLPDHPVWLKPWTLFTNPCKPTAFVKRHMKEEGET